MWQELTLLENTHQELDPGGIAPLDFYWRDAQFFFLFLKLQYLHLKHPFSYMTKGDWSRNGFFMQTKLTRILSWVFQHQNLRKRLSLFLVQEVLPHRENIGDHVYCQISVREDELKTEKKKVLLTFLLLVSACTESRPSAFPITLHVVLLFCFFFYVV